MSRKYGGYNPPSYSNYNPYAKYDRMYNSYKSSYSNEEEDYNDYVDLYRSENSSPYEMSGMDFDIQKINSMTKDIEFLGGNVKAPEATENEHTMFSRVLEAADIMSLPFNAIAGAIDEVATKTAEEDGNAVEDIVKAVPRAITGAVKSGVNTILAPFSKKAANNKVTSITLAEKARDGSYGSVGDGIVDAADETSKFLLSPIATTINEMGGNATSAIEFFGGDLDKASEFLTNVATLIPEMYATKGLGALDNAGNFVKAINTGVDSAKVIDKVGDVNKTGKLAVDELLKPKFAENGLKFDDALETQTLKSFEKQAMKDFNSFDSFEGIKFYGKDNIPFTNIKIGPEQAQKIAENWTPAQKVSLTAAITVLDPFAGVYGLSSMAKNSKFMKPLNDSAYEMLPKYFKSDTKNALREAINNDPGSYYRALSGTKADTMLQNAKALDKNKIISKTNEYIKALKDEDITDYTRITKTMESPETSTQLHSVLSMDRDALIKDAKLWNNQEQADLMYKLRDLDDNFAKANPDATLEEVLRMRTHVADRIMALDELSTNNFNKAIDNYIGELGLGKADGIDEFKDYIKANWESGDIDRIFEEGNNRFFAKTDTEMSKAFNKQELDRLNPLMKQINKTEVSLKNVAMSKDELKAFKQAIKGRIKVSDNGIPINSYMTELKALYPETFKYDVVQDNMSELADAISTFKTAKKGELGGGLSLQDMDHFASNNGYKAWNNLVEKLEGADSSKLKALNYIDEADAGYQKSLTKIIDEQPEVFDSAEKLLDFNKQYDKTEIMRMTTQEKDDAYRFISKINENNIDELIPHATPEIKSEYVAKGKRMKEIMDVIDEKKASVTGDNSLLSQIEKLKKLDNDTDELVESYKKHLEKQGLDTNERKLYETVKSYNSDNLSEIEKKILKEQQDEFKKAAYAEGITNKMDDYVPHIVNDEFRSNKKVMEVYAGTYSNIKKTMKGKKNKFQNARTIEGTIEEANKLMKKELADKGIDIGDKKFFKDNSVEIFHDRMMASNEIIYSNKIGRNFAQTFGTVEYSKKDFFKLKDDEIEKALLRSNLKPTKAEDLDLSLYFNEKQIEKGIQPEKLKKAQAFDSYNKHLAQLRAKGYTSIPGDMSQESTRIIQKVDRQALIDFLKNKGYEDVRFLDTKGKAGVKNNLDDLRMENAVPFEDGFKLQKDFIDVKSLPKEIQNLLKNIEPESYLRYKDMFKDDLVKYADYMPDSGIKFKQNITPGKNYLVGKDAYTKFENMRKTTYDFDKNQFLKLFDYFTGMFKRQATFSLSFDLRNAIGNNLNSYLNAGTNIFDAKTNAYAKLMRNFENQEYLAKNEKLVQELEAKLGKKFDEIIKESQLHGLYSSVLDEGENTLLKNTMNPMEETALSKANKNFNFMSKDWKGYELKGNISEGVEQQARLVNYLTHMQRGDTAIEAVEKVNKVLFDYNDLSFFEKSVLKRLSPFITFSRKNLPLMFDSMANNKQAQNLLGKVYRAGSATESEEDRMFKPEYMDNMIHFGGKYYNIGSPISNLTDYVENPFGAVKDSLNPLIKLATGAEDSTGRKADVKSVAPLLGVSQDIVKGVTGDTNALKRLGRKAGSLAYDLDAESQKQFAIKDYKDQVQAELNAAKAKNPLAAMELENKKALSQMPKAKQKKVSEYLKASRKSIKDLTPMELMLLDLK